MQMNLELATEIVLETQNSYLRGELSDERLADVLEIHPGAARDWDKMKLNLRVRRRKLMKRAVDALKSALHKSRCCKNYRPGKQWTTNSKEVSKLHKIKRQFFREGLNVLETYANFIAEADIKVKS